MSEETPIKRFSFTQPMCGSCYNNRFPGRAPAVLKEEYTETEVCVDCGNETKEGIYMRIDPQEARFPTRIKD